jgi:uncharacterized RDD family membrane protein YckC
LTTTSAPGLLRRLAAILYDGLLLVAIVMLVTAALLFFTGGHAISSGNPAYRCLLLVTGVLFFASFWTRDGQTLGMRAWRLRVERFDGGRLRWRDALARAAAALLSWVACGLGFLWVLVDAQGLAWHDHLSRTRLVTVVRSAHPHEPDEHDPAEHDDRKPADENG